MVDINTNYHESTKYIINLLHGNIKVVTKYFLKSINVPDIASFIISSEDYINESKNIMQKKLKTSCFQYPFHLCKRNPNPSMTSYVIYIQKNPIQTWCPPQVIPRP